MKLTFYDWLLKNGICERKAIEYTYLYAFGGNVSNLENVVFIQNLIDCYEDYRKGLC